MPRNEIVDIAANHMKLSFPYSLSSSRAENINPIEAIIRPVAKYSVIAERLYKFVKLYTLQTLVIARA